MALEELEKSKSDLIFEKLSDTKVTVEKPLLSLLPEGSLEILHDDGFVTMFEINGWDWNNSQFDDFEGYSKETGVDKELWLGCDKVDANVEEAIKKAVPTAIEIRFMEA
jgi:hypothetical protein